MRFRGIQDLDFGFKGLTGFRFFVLFYVWLRGFGVLLLDSQTLERQFGFVYTHICTFVEPRLPTCVHIYIYEYGHISICMSACMYVKLLYTHSLLLTCPPPIPNRKP